MMKFGFSGERALCRWIDAARIVLALLSILLAAILLLKIFQFDAARQDVLVRQAGQARDAYDLTVDCYARQADLALNLAVLRPEVLELVAAAWAVPDEEQRAPLRSRLLEIMAPVHADLVQSGFRQFHFHFPDCTSFLRVHLPHQFGDPLAEKRPTVVEANRTRRKVTAFEEGVLFNGYRNVYPLEYRGEPIGSVEIGFSSRALLEGMDRKVGGRHALLIRRDVVESTVQPSSRGNYRDWNWSDTYLQDAETAAMPLLEPGEAVRDTVDFRQRIADGLAARSDFSLRTRIRGRTSAWHFLAIADHAGQQVGYWLVRQDCPAVDALDRYVTMSLGIFGTLLALSIAGFAWLGHVRRRFEEMSAFLPVCATCKKVREPGADSKSPDSWMTLEAYFARHTDSQVTHGICPMCLHDALAKRLP